MMFNSADQIIGKLLVGQLIGDVETSATDAAVIGADKFCTCITTAGAETRGLGNAREGTMKLLLMTTDGGDAVVTPTAFIATTITFNDAGDAWLGIFLKGEWKTIYASATVA
jgi:hypothetical protein